MIVPGTSGGVSPGAGTKQSGLKVHDAPLTSTLRSPEPNTFVTLPS